MRTLAVSVVSAARRFLARPEQSAPDTHPASSGDTMQESSSTRGAYGSDHLIAVAAFRARPVTPRIKPLLGEVGVPNPNVIQRKAEGCGCC